MSDRHLNYDAESGQFVSDEYVEANPGTTYTRPFPQPDPLDAALAEYTQLTEGQMSWTVHAVPGIEITGTDPREMAEDVVRRVKTILEATE